MSVRRTGRANGHGGSRDGVRHRRQAARGLHLQRAVPVLGRRGPGRRCLRHRRSPGTSTRARSRASTSSGLTIAVSVHIPENVLDPEVLEGRRSSSTTRASDAQQQGALLKVCSPDSSAARSPTSPGSSARSSRSSARRSRSPSTAARAGSTIGDDRRCRPRSRYVGATGKPTVARRRPFLHDPGLPGLRGQVRATSRATGQRARHARASTGTATTPSRATSASRPDAEGRRAMFAVAHLRDPRRDRAILGGSLVALSALAWLSLWAWAASPYAPLPPPRGRRRPHARSRRSLFVAGLGPDDRRDDAAVERAARRHVRRHRRPAAAAAAARRAAARRLPRRLGRLRRSPPGSSTAASTPPSTPARGSRRIRS